MKPVKAWAICNRRGIAPFKYVPQRHLEVGERCLPLWRRKADAESWRNGDESEYLVRVEIREVPSKRPVRKRVTR